MKNHLNKAIKLYREGISLNNLKGVLEVKSRTTVARHLKREGVQIRKKGYNPRAASLNHKFFNIINTEEKAYWLGFLAADGTIYSNSPYIKLALAKKDSLHLIKFGLTLECNKRIREVPRTNSVEFRLFSHHLKDDLINHGVPPRKSLILNPPIGVPKYLIHHWIRGYFDGDGCIFIIKREKRLYLGVSVIGTVKVLWFILNETGLAKPKIVHQRNSKAFSFRFSYKKGIEKFRNYIYKDATIYLERKRNKFYGFQSNKNISPS